MSTYVIAASASTMLRDKSSSDNTMSGEVVGTHLMSTTKGITLNLASRCTTFLNKIDAPNSMKSLLNDRLTDTMNEVTTTGFINSMKQLSEWFAFLDYCERSPLRYSASRGFKEEDGTIHPLWMVGRGVFDESPSVLSVPSETWCPELLFLAEKWMVDFYQANPTLRGFLMGGAGLGMDHPLGDDIDHCAAVMSWNDPHYLEKIHKKYDIAAGMMAYHKYPIIEDEEEDSGEDCYLNWVSKTFCDINPTIRESLGRSKLKWMMDGTEYDNDMLATVQINRACIPANHMDKFGERIIRAMGKNGAKFFGK